MLGETNKVRQELEVEKKNNERNRIQQERDREAVQDKFFAEIEKRFANIGNSQPIGDPWETEVVKDATWYKNEQCRIETNRETFLEELDTQSRDNGDFKMIGGNTAPLPSRIPTYSEFREEARSWRAILGNKMKELPVIEMYLETIKISPKDIAAAEVLDAEWNRTKDEGLLNHTLPLRNS